MDAGGRATQEAKAEHYCINQRYPRAMAAPLKPNYSFFHKPMCFIVCSFGVQALGFCLFDMFQRL
ncbi:MAG: hypothetical protein COA68_10990 [Oceanobacter sp.]|nr:MAG: hypothetical protein COA68_10990 [Oceanobacter sp.]